MRSASELDWILDAADDDLDKSIRETVKVKGRNDNRIIGIMFPFG